jgi:hypothetical protein
MAYFPVVFAPVNAIAKRAVLSFVVVSPFLHFVVMPVTAIAGEEGKACPRTKMAKPHKRTKEKPASAQTLFHLLRLDFSQANSTGPRRSQ